jgi:hypothetical protein
MPPQPIASAIHLEWFRREAARPAEADQTAPGSIEDSERIATAAVSLTTLLFGLLSCWLFGGGAWRLYMHHRLAARLSHALQDGEQTFSI